MDAPSFTLPDSVGQAWSLEATLARGPVVLLFYRGAWCPFCNLTLRAYAHLLPELTARGVTLLAISPQQAEYAQAMRDQHQLGFPMLVDHDSAVARRYGLIFAVSDTLRQINTHLGVDLADYHGNDGADLPMPGTFLVDRHGCIWLAFTDPDFTRRLEPDVLLTHVDRLYHDQAPRLT